MTLIEALNDTTLRAKIDCIEDIKASLDGRSADDCLHDCLESACADFEALTGIDLR
jgi:hypothetical protein